MNTTVLIEEVGLDEHGNLYIRPNTTSSDDYAYIWRDASGIRWNAHNRTFHADEPKRWAALDLYQQIINAAHGEYRVQLTLAGSTAWPAISLELRMQIESHATSTFAR